MITTQAKQAKRICGKSLDDILDNNNCAPLMAKDPSCVAEKEESEPCKLPKGVRTALTITGVRFVSASGQEEEGLEGGRTNNFGLQSILPMSSEFLWDNATNALGNNSAY